LALFVFALGFFFQQEVNAESAQSKTLIRSDTLSPLLSPSAPQLSMHDAAASNPSPCFAVDSIRHQACLDSLATLKRDSILHASGKPPTLRKSAFPVAKANIASASSEADEEESDESKNEETSDAVQQERNSIYIAQLFSDVNAGSSGDAKEWAEWFYVAAVVLIVGAVIITVPKLLWDLSQNKERYPVSHEFNLGYTYSGQSWEGGGSPLYRDTHMASLRYTVMIQKPILGIGLTTQGGYLAPHLRSTLEPIRNIDAAGAFLMVGPCLRFGAQSPVSLSFDFLNGTSTAEAVGWITQTMATLQWRHHQHYTVALRGGSLFYDLHFFDGLAYREGSFNRDINLIMGIETGYAF